MASNCTEESLKSYNKQQLIKLFLEAQQQSNETIIKLTNEIKLLKENYKKLELKILVSVNWTNAQYSNREREKLLRYPLKFFIGF